MMTRRRGAALWPGLTLACLLAVLAFVLSFDALRIVALACGVQPALAWMFPLIVDGSTLAFTWATWAFRARGMGTWYPWLMLVLFSVVSLIGNALHAHPVQVNGMLLPDWVPPLVMTMPPIALLATTHMIVMAAGRTFRRAAGRNRPETDAGRGRTVRDRTGACNARPAAARAAGGQRPGAGRPLGRADERRLTRRWLWLGPAGMLRRGPTITIVTRRRPRRRVRARAPRHALHGRASCARGSGR